MKTVKISALVLAMAGVFATSANAQSAKTNAWEGFFGQYSVGFASFSPKIGSTTIAPVSPLTAYTNPQPYGLGGNINVSPSSSTLNTATNAISAGYNFGVNESYVLGLGASYYVGATGSGNGSFTLTAPGGTFGGGAYNAANLNATSAVQYQLKNLWAVTLQPGYVIDKNKLVYAKVGYTAVTIGLNSATAPYQTTNLSGYTLGLGYKQMVTESVYLLGEANYGSFSNKAATITSSLGTLNSTIGGTGYDFLVGVGYRF
jgi:outer membrane immunogenic protein